MDLSAIGSILAEILSQSYVFVLGICGCIIGVLTSFVIINMVRGSKNAFEEVRAQERGGVMENAVATAPSTNVMAATAAARPTAAAATAARPTAAAATAARPTAAAATAARPTATAKASSENRLENKGVFGSNLEINNASNFENVKTILKSGADAPNQQKSIVNEVKIENNVIGGTGVQVGEFYQLRESLMLLRKKLKDIQDRKHKVF
ncbi:MAG: hypothetical protein JTT11_03845 [Candidatus Brockarchaeota archaeon]|nr:hypothetical protein [Candidatus Brockarchaeota archaeon]